MTNFLRKSALIGLLSIFSLGTFLAVPTEVYAKASKPKITVSERNSTDIVIRVKQTDLKKDKVKVRFSIQNVATGEKTTQTFSVKLNSDGQKKVTIKDLVKATEYKIKAKIKDRNDKNYSNSSKTLKVSTRP